MFVCYKDIISKDSVRLVACLRDFVIQSRVHAGKSDMSAPICYIETQLQATS